MDEQLEKLHGALLCIAREVDRLCRENGIAYSLLAGTLIGAVRHQGFIPWDDDMDIAMLRGDYERFLTVCETDLDPRFELQTNRNDPDYPYAFAKLCLRGTHFEMAGHEKEPWQKGIFVDIFPMDNVPPGKLARRFHAAGVYYWKKLLDRKAGMRIARGKGVKTLFFRALDLLSRLYSAGSLRRHLDRTLRRYEHADTGEVGNLCGIYGYERETTRSAFFQDRIDVPFAGATFSILRDYDVYLTQVYGDYMTPPPPEKRRTHHFTVLDLGTEEHV